MRQEYDKYTAESHQVWSILYGNQIELLQPIATKAYLEGMKRVQFKPNYIPNFDIVNKMLGDMTGWEVYPVPGLIDNKPFFEHLSRREFPATTWLRKMSQLKYIEEPDMFHDVFGHIPLLTEPSFCKYLQDLSIIALDYIDNPSIVELITRMYWYTVEFGLIQEDGVLKIYGAGILSSSGESLYSVSDKASHRPYDIQGILDKPYIKDQYQSEYFVIESYEQLYESLPELRAKVRKYVAENIEVVPSS